MARKYLRNTQMLREDMNAAATLMQDAARRAGLRLEFWKKLSSDPNPVENIEKTRAKRLRQLAKRFRTRAKRMQI